MAVVGLELASRQQHICRGDCQACDLLSMDLKHGEELATFSKLVREINFGLERKIKINMNI